MIAALFLYLHALLYPSPAYWVPRGELKRIQRYHGTAALKLTNTKVFIWRDKRWIVVKQRFQTGS